MPPNLSIPRSSIVIGDRYRKVYGDLTGLKESITRVGSIHPVVLSQRPDELLYDLIAGGRRMAAHDELGIKEYHHGSVLEPGRIGFLFKQDVPEDELREAELDENLHRFNTQWHEEVLQISDIHALKQKKLGKHKWGQRQTAALLGTGFHESNVNLALKVAELIRAKDPEILAASNLSEATVIRIKRREELTLKEATRRAIAAGLMQDPNPTPITLPTTPTSVASFLDSFIIPTSRIPESSDATTPAPSISVTLQTAPVAKTDPFRIPLSFMFRHGDNRELSWPSVNHIVTDIPYGIDMENLDPTQVADVKDQHDITQNVGLMKGFLQRAFEAVKPSGFCVFFYDQDHHEKLRDWAREAGWKVQRWAFIACKTSSCQNNAAQFNLTKNYEQAMFLRKDTSTVLRHDPKFALNNSSWQQYDFAAERRLYNNPFAKPFQLWKDIYDMIAFPGQSVYDPYCGEMSACRAAVHCGLLPYGDEINEKHYQRGLEHMRGVYATIHKSNVLFI